jgi:hypothetical protein
MASFDQLFPGFEPMMLGLFQEFMDPRKISFTAFRVRVRSSTFLLLYMTPTPAAKIGIMRCWRSTAALSLLDTGESLPANEI